MARNMGSGLQAVAIGTMLAVGGFAAQAQEQTQRLKSNFEPSAPAADPALTAEAEKLAQNVWRAALSECGQSAIQRVDDRLLIELEKPSYKLVAQRLPDAAKQSGYDFRGVALASAPRWRWAKAGGGTPKWSEWTLGETTNVRDDNLTLDRGVTVVRDVVLKFDIVKKDGKWQANAPVSLLSYAVKPLDPTQPAAPKPKADCPAGIAAK